MCWRFCLSGLGCVINNHNQGDREGRPYNTIAYLLDVRVL